MATFQMPLEVAYELHFTSECPVDHVNVVWSNLRSAYLDAEDKKIVLPTFSENKAAVKTIINWAMVNVLAFYSGDQSSNPSTV